MSNDTINKRAAQCGVTPKQWMESCAEFDRTKAALNSPPPRKQRISDQDGRLFAVIRDLRRSLK